MGDLQIHGELLSKYERLRGIISSFKSAIVAYSGGVDSTLLLKVSFDLLGDRVLAVTARSESFPEREVEEAERLASLIGCRHIIIRTQELEVPGFSSNPPHRCYLCKRELFEKLKDLAAKESVEVILEGSNADDTKDYRPGRMAVKEAGVRSPLEEAGITKEEVRALSRALGLPNWSRPSFACLASRFPYNTEITVSSLRQVQRAEEYLRELGFEVFRVRHHGTVARIELGEKDMRRLWEGSLFQDVVRGIKATGYKYVALDLEGYRTGSMNETLDHKELVKITS